MQLCLSTRTHPYRPLAEALELLRPSGIAALDLAATLETPHLALGSAEPATAVRPLIEGWRVAAITADHPDFPRLREEGQADAVAWTVRAIEAAAELGAPVVTTSLGSTGVDAWDSAWDRALDGLRTVLRRTAQSEVRLAVRLDAGDVLDSLRKVRRLLEAIPDPRLGIAHDTGFLHFLRIPFREALEAAGSRLYHVQLRDAVRNDYRRPIGQGEVNFGSLLRQLRQFGYQGPLTIELSSVGTEPALASANEAVVMLRALVDEP